MDDQSFVRDLDDGIVMSWNSPLARVLQTKTAVAITRGRTEQWRHQLRIAGPGLSESRTERTKGEEPGNSIMVNGNERIGNPRDERPLLEGGVLRL